MSQWSPSFRLQPLFPPFTFSLLPSSPSLSISSHLLLAPRAIWAKPGRHETHFWCNFGQKPYNNPFTNGMNNTQTFTHRKQRQQQKDITLGYLSYGLCMTILTMYCTCVLTVVGTLLISTWTWTRTLYSTAVATFFCFEIKSYVQLRSKFEPPNSHTPLSSVSPSPAWSADRPQI